MAGPELNSPNVLPSEMVDAQKMQYYQGCLSSIETRESEFEKGWWKAADAAEKLYVADKKEKEQQTPYNILYSNTEVLLPSLYSATPKPDVRARFKGMKLKPLPEVLDRFLTVAADPSSPGGDTFDGAMQDCVLSSLVPGMGYVRIRYTEDRAFPISYESGHFKTIIWGKATRWSKVPWIAFKHPMKRAEMYKKFEIPEESQNPKPAAPDASADDDKDDCCVYEFWDKSSGKILFLCDEYVPKLLRETPDPLGLENFYPTPGLMSMTMRSGKFTPIPLYNYYSEQAEELNRVSVRLIKVLSAIRVRGAYNGLLGDDLKKILAADEMENELIPASEAGLLAQSGGFDKHIWLLPIEKLITVAKELYGAREAIKQVIYEITGISDIIRGSSAPSETATAQDLKNKWGTVRLRRMQTVVANYARDLFRMTVDCSSDHVAPEKWAEICQMPEIPSAAQKQQAQMQLQQMAQMQAMQAPMMPPGMPPQPSMPPQAPPQQPDPKLLATVQSPSWEELLGKINQDQNRAFTVNIQTSSTIDLDTAQDKAEVSEFMNAMGQLLPGLQGLASIGPTGMEAAKAILAAVCQRFKFGIDIADVIEKIQPPPPAPPEQKGPPPPTPEELQATKMEQQAKMQKVAGDMEVMNAKKEYDLAKIAADREKLGLEVQEAQLRLQASRAKIAAQAAMPAKPAKTATQ